MTAPHIVDPARLLGQALGDASPDLMRHLLPTVINALLSAEADAVVRRRVGPASRRTGSTQRNGYRHRDLDTRVGTIDVAIPKLRSGTYFPEWLLERRKRAEAALITVVATCYLLGVSTRRMDKLVQTLGITSLSKSQVSRMAADLDAQVTAFRTRPLGEAGPFTFVAADALTMKVREDGRVVNAVVLVATGVNADGHREVLGVQGRHRETRTGVEHVLRRPGRPRPDRGPAGHQRRPRRPGRGDRGEPARRHLATLPHPLRREPDGVCPKSACGRRSRRCCTRSTTSPTPTPSTPSSTGCSTPWPTSCPPSPTTSTPPAPTSSRSPASPRRSGARSGPTTPTNASTGRSAAAPTSSASSPTATPSSASSAPSWPNRHDEWAEGRRYLGLDVLTRARLTVQTTTDPEPQEQPLALSA